MTEAAILQRAEQPERDLQHQKRIAPVASKEYARQEYPRTKTGANGDSEPEAYGDAASRFIGGCGGEFDQKGFSAVGAECSRNNHPKRKTHRHDAKILRC